MEDDALDTSIDDPGPKKICPHCRTGITPGSPETRCQHCGIAHHADCWQQNQGCTTFGCAGQASGIAPGSPSSNHVQPSVGSQNGCCDPGTVATPTHDMFSRPLGTTGSSKKAIWIVLALAIVVGVGFYALGVYRNGSQTGSQPNAIQSTANGQEDSPSDPVADASGITSALDEHVHDWRNAWQEHDLEQFMSLYASTVMVDGKAQSRSEYRTYHATENERQPTMTVDVSDLRITVQSPERAVTTFKQHFRGEGAKPEWNWESWGRTRLVWIIEDGNWRISEESYTRERGGRW